MKALTYAICEIPCYTKDDLDDALLLRNDVHYLNLFVFNDEDSKLIVVIGFCKYYDISEFNEHSRWDFEEVPEPPLYHDYETKYEDYSACRCRDDYGFPDKSDEDSIEFIGEVFDMITEPDEEMQEHLEEVEDILEEEASWEEWSSDAWDTTEDSEVI